MTNYYAILGVPPSARPEALKSAYRQAARETHPDHSGDRERFQQVQQAYAVLSDPKKRAEYDRARDIWMRQIGAVCCRMCGHANRITRQPRAHEIVRCWSCHTPLGLDRVAFTQAQRQSLAHEATRLVDELGVDLVHLASDAMRSGIHRLRLRLGIPANDKGKP